MQKIFVIIVFIFGCCSFVGCSNSSNVLIRDMWTPSANYASLDQTNYYLGGQQVWGPGYGYGNSYSGYANAHALAVPANGPYVYGAGYNNRQVTSYQESYSGAYGRPVHRQGVFQSGSAGIVVGAGAGTEGPNRYNHSYSYKNKYKSQGAGVVIRPK